MNTTPNTTPTGFLSGKVNLLGVLLGILGGVIALIVVAIIVMSLFFKAQATGSGLESLASGIFAVYGIVLIVAIGLVMLIILPFYLSSRKNNMVQIPKTQGTSRWIIGIISLAGLSIILIYVLMQL